MSWDHSKVPVPSYTATKPWATSWLLLGVVVPDKGRTSSKVSPQMATRHSVRCVGAHAGIYTATALA